MHSKIFLVGLFLLGIAVAEDSSAFVAPKKQAKNRSKSNSANVVQPKNKVLMNRAETDYKRHEREMRYRQFQQMQQTRQRAYQQQMQSQQGAQAAN